MNVIQASIPRVFRKCIIAPKMALQSPQQAIVHEQNKPASIFETVYISANIADDDSHRRFNPWQAISNLE